MHSCTISHLAGCANLSVHLPSELGKRRRGPTIPPDVYPVDRGESDQSRTANKNNPSQLCPHRCQGVNCVDSSKVDSATTAVVSSASRQAENQPAKGGVL